MSDHEMNLLQLLPGHLLSKTGLKLEVDDLLTIEKSKLFDSYDVIESVFKQMRHLRIFNKDFPTFEKIVVHCGQNLKSVVVYSKPPSFIPMDLSTSQIELLARHCPNLELPSSGWRKNTFLYLSELDRHGHQSKLRKLYFENKMIISEFSRYLKICPNIERLQFFKWRFLDALELDLGKLVIPSLRSILVLHHIEIEGRDLFKTVNELKSELKSILTTFNAIDMIKVLKNRNINRIKITGEIDFYFEQLVEIWSNLQASKIVAIKYATVAYWDLWKIQPDASNLIEQMSLSKYHCNHECIELLTSSDRFRNLKVLKVSIRYDNETLQSMIRLVQIRGHTIRTLELEPMNKSIIYDIELLDNILEYCSNLKTCNVQMSIDENSTIKFDHEFFQKLYSIRVRRVSYFKLDFRYGSVANYWKSVYVLEGMLKPSNKMVELETRDSVYKSWKPQNVNELKLQRDIDQLSTEEFWAFIDI